MGFSELLGSAVALFKDRSRRTWISETRAHIEYPELGREELRRFAQAIERLTSELQHLEWAEVNPHTRRVVFAFAPKAFGLEELEGLVALLAADGQHTQGRIEVEVPESVLTEDPMRGTEMVRKLHEMGMRVSIDDFGAGYTSLRTISELGVDGLKIDRSFIATIGSIPADAAVVRSTIEFCHEIGVEVTALGVNDESALDVLTEMGCDLAQGSFVCEPVGLAELPTRVADIRRSRI